MAPVAALSPPPPSLPVRLLDAVAQAKVGEQVTVQGWLRSVRRSKQVAFLALSDGSMLEPLQVVFDPEQYQSLLPSLQTGASVHVTGRWQASPGAKQGMELVEPKITLLGAADPATYPLQKKGHTLDFLRTITHLRPRTNTFSAIFRIRATLANATHRFFHAHGFCNVQTPILTTSDCEGAGELFEIANMLPQGPFFGSKAWLTVSGQLNGESLAYGLGRIYTFGPTFRAENSNTTRHLSEFWMVEPEAMFFDAKANQTLAQAYLQACVAAALQERPEDIAFLAQHYDPQLPDMLTQLVVKPFAHMTYTQAIDALQASKHAFTFPPSWGADLQTEHERYLVEHIAQGPVIVTDYPKTIKAFYMYQNEDDKTVAAMDVLVPRIGELIGGSQREHRLERLESRLRQMGMPLENYQWYREVQSFGAAPHAGFGLGFERLVMLVTGMANIRDVIPSPRAPGLATA